MSKKWLAALGAIVSLSAHAFTPVSGTWIINSELNGKPGRGLAIDVQNGTVVMQVYGYESNGAPTFYMGTSTSYTGEKKYMPLELRWCRSSNTKVGAIWVVATDPAPN